MLEYFAYAQLSSLQWGLAILAAIVLGIGKSGLNSVTILTVSLLAYVFGSKTSTGILLPMMLVADVFAVFYYRKHAQWTHLIRLLPWMLVGVILGWWVGKDLDERLFKKVMAAILFFSIALLFVFERKKNPNIPQHWAFASAIGLGAGFTTMIGNLAGGISNIYFLSMRLSKNHFIGSTAWLFFIINLFKLPFHIFSWHTINADSLGINIVLLPFALLGFMAGKRFLQRLTDEGYRKLVIGLTAASVLFIVFA